MTFGFSYSLYEVATGNCVITQLVSGSRMGTVLEHIARVVSEHGGTTKVNLKVMEARLNDGTVIVDANRLESLNTLVTLSTEHYNQKAGTLVVETSHSTKSVAENLQTVLSDPKKLKRLVDEAVIRFPKDRMPKTRTHSVNGWDLKYLPGLRKWSVGGVHTADTKSEAIAKAHQKPGPKPVTEDVDTKYHNVAKKHGLTWKRGGPTSGDYEGRKHTLYSNKGQWSVQDNAGKEIGTGKTPNSAHKFLSNLTELELPSLEVGDTLLVGKFKNRKAEIKGFSTDDKGQPVAQTSLGDQKIFKPRVAKLIPTNEDIGNDLFKDTKGMNVTVNSPGHEHHGKTGTIVRQQGHSHYVDLGHRKNEWFNSNQLNTAKNTPDPVNDVKNAVRTKMQR